MRIAKYLAQAGISSRRQAEVLIEQGRVKLNGKVVKEVAAQVDPSCDLIEFDGKLVGAEEPIYILLFKPAGYICTVHDPQGRTTVLELLKDIKARIYPVGRLDYDTEGLLLLTNDGDFANLIIHPRYKIDKHYEARLEGYIKDEELKQLQEGVELEDGVTSPAEVQVLDRKESFSIINLTIHEGRKRQVKRMCAAVGHPVLALKRKALGFLTLQGLGKGQYRYLSLEEVECLKEMAINSRAGTTQDNAHFRVNSDKEGQV